MDNSANPHHLAEVVRRSRIRVGYRTATSLAKAMGVSTRLIGEIENGRRDSYSRSTLVALDEALGWEIGSAQKVLLGGEPAESPTGPKNLEQLTPVGYASLVEALELGEDRLSGLTDADLAEIEMVARLAASERARALQAEKREAIGERAVEAVHRSVDTRSTTSPTRTTAQETR